MSNQPRKTSNIVKRVDDVEETIPDYYGPQAEEPVGEFKKGDMYFVSGADGLSSLPPRPRKPRRVVEQPTPRKRTKPLQKAKKIQTIVRKLHRKRRR